MRLVLVGLEIFDGESFVELSRAEEGVLFFEFSQVFHDRSLPSFGKPS